MGPEAVSDSVDVSFAFVVFGLHGVLILVDALSQQLRIEDLLHLVADLLEIALFWLLLRLLHECNFLYLVRLQGQLLRRNRF